MKSIRTYFLVADETEARLLENHGVGKGIHQLSHHTEKDSGLAPNDFADQRASSQGAGGQARHGVDPSTTERENARKVFAADLADMIKDADQKGKFDRLVLSAPPQMLGVLRSILDGKVEIYADMDKNLVKTPTGDLAKHFAGVVAV